MSLYDYNESKKLSVGDPPFASLIMGAIRKADDINAAKLKSAFPGIFNELQARYNSPGGVLDDD